MNSKLRTALEDLRSAVEWCIDPQRLSGVYVDRDKADKAVAEAEKAIRKAVAEEILEIIDSPSATLVGSDGAWIKQAELRQKITEWKNNV